jgi:phage antirepressor YoqD-like protein/predicted transcriptional regulator
MNSIIAMADTSLTMTSRELADLVEKRHDNVKRTIETLVERGVIASPQIEEKTETGGRPGTEYRVGKRDSYVIVAQLSPEFTARLVDRWQELESAKSPALPQTFAQALRLAAEQQEQIEAQQLKIETDRPKVEYADALLNADGTTLVRDVAKTLGVGPMKLHKALKEKGVILGNNAPASEYVQKGYFVESIHTYETTTAGSRIAHAARVTGRGIEFIRRFVARHGELLTRQPAKGVAQ